MWNIIAKILNKSTEIPRIVQQKVLKKQVYFEVFRKVS